jgi:hypothetical protein
MTKTQWIKGGMKFDEIVVKSAKVKGLSVSLSWDCHEGNEGDFNPKDKTDEPLLRFDISKTKRRGEFEELQDSSFCTQLVAYGDRKLLTQAAKVILKEAEGNCSVTRGGFFYQWKRIMEGMSWMGIQDGKLV